MPAPKPIFDHYLRPSNIERTFSGRPVAAANKLFRGSSCRPSHAVVGLINLMICRSSNINIAEYLLPLPSYTASFVKVETGERKMRDRQCFQRIRVRNSVK
nr:hypothetical protein Iba_chr09bCG13070 [Ipomoea batatas]